MRCEKLRGVFCALLLSVILTGAAAQEWSVPVNYQSGTATIDLAFGVNASATDGFDANIDVPSPPLPPGATKYAYFSIDDPIFPMLFEDYRPIINQSNPLETWELVVASDEEITLTWDASEVPASISLEMNVSGDIVDMEDQTSYTLSAETYTIYIEAKDAVPPVITNVQPVGTLTITTVPSQITISASYSDNIGIDVSSVTLIVNGNDVTDQATVTESAISYSITVNSEGIFDYDVSLEVADVVGNTNSTSWSFTVVADETPPVISNISPTETVYGLLPMTVMISANYSDNIGIDVNSVTLIVNGNDVTDQAVVTESGISYDYTVTAEGTYTVYLEVADLVGHVTNTTWSFDVSQAVTVTIPLAQGWNMISLPVSEIIEIDVPPSVSPYAYWYNPATGWYDYPPVSEMQPGKGYWVAAAQDCNITVTGIPVQSLEVNLTQGWNMVGSVYVEIPVTFGSYPPNAVYPYAFWYNPETGWYDMSAEIEQGKGYWILAYQDCTLYIPAPPTPPVPSS